LELSDTVIGARVGLRWRFFSRAKITNYPEFTDGERQEIDLNGLRTPQIVGRDVSLEEWVTSVEAFADKGKTPEKHQDLLIKFMQYEFTCFMPFNLLHHGSSWKARVSVLKWDDRLYNPPYPAPPSCYSTAWALQATFLKEVVVIEVSKAKQWIKPDKAKSFIENELGIGKLVKVKIDITNDAGASYSDHWFTLWKSSGNIKIVHGWQGKIFVKIEEHTFVVGCNLMDKFLSIDDTASMNQDATTKSIKDKVKAFVKFFKLELNIEGLVQQKNSNVFRVKTVTSGFPTSTVPTLEKACYQSNALFDAAFQECASVMLR